MVSANHKPQPPQGRAASLTVGSGTQAGGTANPRAAAAGECNETELFEILERFPHDERIHAQIIARDHLSDALLTRLIALLSDTQLDELFARHPLPLQSRGEILKRSPSRPPWWRRSLLNTKS